MFGISSRYVFQTRPCFKIFIIICTIQSFGNILLLNVSVCVTYSQVDLIINQKYKLNIIGWLEELRSHSLKNKTLSVLLSSDITMPLFKFRWQVFNDFFHDQRIIK